jgi:16S rRNA (uracil1498-N3)-methyltransferase
MARSRGRLFFARECDPARGSAALLDEEVRHAYQVLRLGRGDEIGVLYEGRKYPGVLDGGRVVRLTGPGETQPKPRIEVLLGVGRPKAQAAPAVVEAATVLGAAEIAFVQAERSVPRGRTGQDRWLRAAREACKQCGRFEPPAIEGPCGLETWLGRVRHAPVKLRLSEAGSAEPGRAASKIRAGCTVAVLCGPEGGFTLQEEARADEAGFVAIRLSPLVLRVEHAAAAVLGRLGPWVWEES